MSYLKQHSRLMVLLLGLVGAAVLFGSFVGNNRADRAEAAATFGNTVTCGDSYLDLALISIFSPAINPNDVRIGDPPAAGTLRVAKSMTRSDAAGGPPPTGVNQVQKLYLGEDTPNFEPTQTDGIADPTEEINDFALGEIIPDAPPDTADCGTKATAANGGAESNDLDIKLSATSIFRPSNATIVSKPKAGIIQTDACVASDVYGWIRQVTLTEQTTTAPKGQNFGVASLMLGTASPTGQVDANGNTVPDYSTNPASCTGGTPFPAWTVATNREPSTDCGPVAGVVADPDGDGVCGVPEPVDGADGLADDWDGDGCTDWDELSKTAATDESGLDPFNPLDCQHNPAGIYNIFVDGGKGSKITCPNAAPECDGHAPGFVTTTATSSFHCVAEINKSGGGPTFPLTGSALCYTESATLASLTGSVVPSWEDGNAGAPPPPPYTSGQVAPGVAGSWNSVTNIATTESCFLGTGAGLLSPNVLAIAEWNTKTGKGLVDIYAHISIADCMAGNEAGGTLFLPNLNITFTRQPATADKDDDGCTDAQELAVLVNSDADDALENPDGKCGDDPYNPNDGPAKTNIGGTYDIAVVVTPADWNGVAVVGGAMFHCKADFNESPDNVLTVRPTCYIDNTLIDINPTAAGLQAGDGLDGSPPPGPTTCNSSCYLPLDASPTVLAGAVTGNNLTVTGCFVDSPPADPLGNVYVDLIVDTKTGVGLVDIYTGQPALCAGSPVGPATFPNASAEIVRQAPRIGTSAKAGWDSDRDGCSDQEENGPTKNIGGLRDPYNRWDWFDTRTGAGLTKDGAIAGTDFFALLGKFNTTDGVPVNGIDRNSDPNYTPVPAGAAYHPAYDRGPAVTGGLTHQTTQPNGSIAGTDFFALLGSFNDTCSAAPNPPKSP